MVVLPRAQTTQFGVLAALLGDTSAHESYLGRIEGTAGAAYSQDFAFAATEEASLARYFSLALTDESTADPGAGSIYVPPGLRTGKLTVFGQAQGTGPVPIYSDYVFFPE